ncbi:MAG: CRTAC1 family protein [bacterium]
MPESIGSGGAFLDYDNDGDLDIYLVNGAWHSKATIESQLLKNRLFRQEQDGTFVDVTELSGLGDTGYGMGVGVGDMDNDGDVDVYVSNYGPDVLFRNNGDGTFTDISKAAGIDNPHWGCSVVFFDYDLDGYLDLYVTNYVAYDSSVKCPDRGGRLDYCGPVGFPGVPDVLYRNHGDGTFVDVSVASGIATVSSKGLGVVSADFNGDVFPDVYVANDGEPNFFWINRRGKTFENRALVLGAAVNELGRSEAGMGIALGDIDNDKDLDLFLTHLRAESNTFYRNSGVRGFEDDTSPAGLSGPSMPYTGFGTGFFDYDHDGDLDLAVVNGRVARGTLLTQTEPAGYWDHYAEPNLLFENDGYGRFRDVSDLDSAFCWVIENSRGLAFGDVDNDGDIDLLVTNDGGNARLYRNDVPHKGHWLMIRAIDPDLRRDAIGAQITVVVGEKQLLRLIAPGYSYLCTNDPRAHFGLGAATAVDEILVQWPDGKTERFPGVAVDQIITLNKGQSKLTHE